MQIIKFTAYLPDIETAITLPGTLDRAARIKLDVPLADMLSVMELKVHGSEHILHVTIEVDEQPLVNVSRPRKKTADKDEDEEPGGEFDGILDEN